MKKLLLVPVLALLAGSAWTQSQRLVFVEEFTQASCPPCASQNPAFNVLLNANTDKAISLKYQVSWPGVDVMNQQNPAQVASRVSYYGVTGVPEAHMDGLVFVNSPSGMTQTMINNQYAVPSPFDIVLTHWLNATEDSVYINCVVTATQAVSMTTPRLRVALMEKLIDTAAAYGTNGETQFENVMRKMYPHAEGTTLENAWTVGESRTVSFKEAIPAYIYDKQELAVVAWVQDDNDKDVKQAGFSEFAGTPSTLAPISDFSADVVTPCNGTVHFRDASALFPTAWLWDFGDGNTSTQQHPTHTYLASGTYTVTLDAINANGSHQRTKASYVTVGYTGAPVVGANDNICVAGVANLAATPMNGGSITWYDSAGTVVGTGSTYSPTVNGTTSFFASEAIANPVLSTGAADTTIAAGVYFTANNTHGLYFDVSIPCELVSVEVYSGAAGNRTIQVYDAYSNVVHSVVRNIPAGHSTVSLNLHFDVGNDYLIKVTSATVNLFRNAGGAAYPYTTNGLTITGNTAAGNPSYYYFFYNWQVQQDPCMSAPTTVTALDTCVTSRPDPAGFVQAFQVSPNPSAQQFELVFEAVQKDDYLIQVSNALGQVVYSERLSGFRGRYAQQLDLGPLGQGIYTLVISNARQRVSRQLVKM